MKRVWSGLLILATLALAGFAVVEQGEIQDLMIELRKRDYYEVQLSRDVARCKAQEVCVRCQAESTRFRDLGMEDVCSKYCRAYENDMKESR